MGVGAYIAVGVGVGVLGNTLSQFAIKAAPSTPINPIVATAIATPPPFPPFILDFLPKLHDS